MFADTIIIIVADMTIVFVRSLYDKFTSFRIKRRVFPPRKIRRNFRASVEFLICIHKIEPIHADVSSAARVEKKSIRFHMVCRHNVTIYYIV